MLIFLVARGIVFCSYIYLFALPSQSFNNRFTTLIQLNVSYEPLQVNFKVLYHEKLMQVRKFLLELFFLTENCTKIYFYKLISGLEIVWFLLFCPQPTVLMILFFAFRGHFIPSFFFFC